MIGLEQYLEALAEEGDARGGGRGVAQEGGRAATGGAHSENAADIGALSVDCQAVMAAAEEAGADGLDARRTAVVLGWDSASASRVEGPV